MNDDFIYKVLPKIPRDFAQSLYARISTSTPTLSQPSRFPGIRSLRRRQVALVILGLILMVAWTQINLWIRYVPIGELWLVEIAHPTQSVGDSPPVGFVPTPRQYSTLIYEGTVFYSWNVHYLSPDWIPEGFSPIDIPPEMDAYGEMLGLWGNNAQETIRFFGVPEAGGQHPYAPTGMYEEVSINDQPAVLIHGRFALPSSENPQATREWDDTLGFQLYWSDGEAVYTLETFGPYLSKRDLIRMAESMKIRPRLEP